MKKIALWVLALVVGAALLALGLWRHSLPQRDGNLPLKGLSAAVQVHYDDFGVPHLQAQNAGSYTHMTLPTKKKG